MDSQKVKKIINNHPFTKKNRDIDAKLWVKSSKLYSHGHRFTRYHEMKLQMREKNEEFLVHGYDTEEELSEIYEFLGYILGFSFTIIHRGPTEACPKYYGVVVEYADAYKHKNLLIVRDNNNAI